MHLVKHDVRAFLGGGPIRFKPVLATQGQVVIWATVALRKESSNNRALAILRIGYFAMAKSSRFADRLRVSVFVTASVSEVQARMGEA